MALLRESVNLSLEKTNQHWQLRSLSHIYEGGYWEAHTGIDQTHLFNELMKPQLIFFLERKFQGQSNFKITRKQFMRINA